MGKAYTPDYFEMYAFLIYRLLQILKVFFNFSTIRYCSFNGGITINVLEISRITQFLEGVK